MIYERKPHHNASLQSFLNPDASEEGMGAVTTESSQDEVLSEVQRAWAARQLRDLARDEGGGDEGGVLDARVARHALHDLGRPIHLRYPPRVDKRRGLHRHRAARRPAARSA